MAQGGVGNEESRKRNYGMGSAQETMAGGAGGGANAANASNALLSWPLAGVDEPDEFCEEEE